MDFRKDINGLRAWAVLAVVLFHFNLPGFSGGFVGVDVFFVISGFLMTSIIVNGLEKQTFSFWGFMRARIRRILPALFVLCAVVMLFGWFVLEGTAYRMLVRHVGSSLLFMSNFKYWREAGYFDDASHDKLLLHTWSLSVEWQFYMLLPLILMVVWKIFQQRQAIVATVAALFAVSLAMSVWLTPQDPSASFYLLHTRAWEMLAGGLVFLFGRRWVLSEGLRKIMAYAGFALIVVSIFGLTPNLFWPGYWAVLPVLGTALVIWANTSTVLSDNPISQWLGTNSYSIYLWHWPLAAVLNFSENAGLAMQLLFIVAALLLGYLSYRWIEIPSKNVLATKKHAGKGLLVLFVAFLGVAYVSYKNFLATWRLPEAAKAIYAEGSNSNPVCNLDMGADKPGCVVGGEKLGVIVIGDSHASAVMQAVQKALPSEDLHVLDWSLPACSTIMGLQAVEGNEPYCGVAKLFEKAKTYDPKVPMLIVNRLAPNFHGRIEKAYSEPEWYVKTKYSDDKQAFYQEIHDAVVETACAFAQYRPVYMLRHIPELKVNVPSVMGKTMAIFGEYRRISVVEADYRERTAWAYKAQDSAAQKCGIQILETAPYFCEVGRCWGDFDGHPVYFDDDHLSLRGADRLIPEFKKIFD